MADLTIVTVNGCAPAVLVKGETVNGNAYYAWDVCGREVFISDTADQARAKMHKALEDGAIF